MSWIKAWIFLQQIPQRTQQQAGSHIVASNRGGRAEYRVVERTKLCAFSAEWGASNNRPARYYQLTAKGRKQLAGEEKNWARLAAAVASVCDSRNELSA